MLWNPRSAWAFRPLRFEPRSWSPHVPFGYDLVAELRPRLLVELGTHTGQSYFTFCQSVRDNDIGTLCYAVDTWKGDPQTGTYGEEVYQDVERHNREHYAPFSYLLRTTFDEARAQFSDGSITVLHIDGYHAYESVRHDYETWRSKVSQDGLILFHDVSCRRPGYGAWKLWEEVAVPGSSFAFDHGWGLGVLKTSPQTRFASALLNLLFESGPDDRRAIMNYYVLVHEKLALERRVCDLEHELKGLRKRVAAPAARPEVV